MKLIDLIEYLINPTLLADLYQENKLIPNETILIYMKGSLELDSEIVFFNLEETADDIKFEKNGNIYYQLFPIDYAVDLIEQDLNLKNKGYSNIEIANRLLKYKLYDA